MLQTHLSAASHVKKHVRRGSAEDEMVCGVSHPVEDHFLLSQILVPGPLPEPGGQTSGFDF